MTPVSIGEKGSGMTVIQLPAAALASERVSIFTNQGRCRQRVVPDRCSDKILVKLEWSETVYLPEKVEPAGQHSD